MTIDIFKISPWEEFQDKGWAWTPQFGYPQDEYYNDSNTKLDEVFGVGPKHIEDFAKKHFDIFSISMIRQQPGQCIPEHCDRHYQFKKIHGEHPKLVRYCVFLEDWVPGHYLEYDSEPIVKWQAGDYIKLWPDVPHRSANMGSKHKYTCQITGVEK